jgi:hypothetical protein
MHPAPAAITPPEEGSALFIIFAYVFPCLGVIISCLFSLSPIPRLKIINRDGKLRGTSVASSSVAHA